MSAKQLRDMGIAYFPWFGQSADPDSIKTGRVNLDILFNEIQKRINQGAFTWGMLDFEDPFNAWLDGPSTDPRYKQASDELVRVIRAVKRQFPNIKWTYYGQPRLSRQVAHNKIWISGTDAEKAAEIERSYQNSKDILAEVDWINPSIYDVYENALFKPDEQEWMIPNEREWRTQNVKLARTVRERLGLPQVPVIPCVALFFQDGGRATVMKPIEIQEVLADQVEPALRGGADGFAIWTSMDFFAELATMPDDKHLEAPNKLSQKQARDAWTKSFFSGRAPGSWTSPEVKFKISQDTGKAIVDGSRAVQEAVLKNRAAKQAQTQ